MDKYNMRYYKITDSREDPLRILLGKGYIGQEKAKAISRLSDFDYLNELNHSYFLHIEKACAKLGIESEDYQKMIKDPALARAGLTQDLKLQSDLDLMIESILAVGKYSQFTYNKEDAKIRQELHIYAGPVLVDAQQLQVDHIASIIDHLQARFEHYGLPCVPQKLESLKSVLASLSDPSNEPLPPGDVRSLPARGSGSEPDKRKR